MNSVFNNNSLMECFRPRGKIVCVGDMLTDELKIIREYLAMKEESRLPLLLLTSDEKSNGLCDQVVVFNTEIPLHQIHSILNSYFVIFVFNSNENEILNTLEKILTSIEFSGSIPIFIDTGTGIESDQRSLLGKCYFHLNFTCEKNRLSFLVLLDSIVTSLNPPIGFGVSFSELMQIFSNSESLYYGLSSSIELDEALNDSINQIGDRLVSGIPEEIDSLETIFLSITSMTPLSLQTMNNISMQIANTFGKEFEIHLANAADSRILEYNVVLILTDIHPIDRIITQSPQDDYHRNYDSNAYSSIETLLDGKLQSSGSFKNTDEDERFDVLKKIFSETEVYIFNDGGLPLFASHRPAGQEVCLYTGLFSAIQSMSSDLIGHTPDQMTAGNKRCVFVSEPGPENAQLRGVAICYEGSEQNAKNNLEITIKLVKEYLLNGEPEYSINDKIQAFLVQGFQNGSIRSIYNSISEFDAS